MAMIGVGERYDVGALLAFASQLYGCLYSVGTRWPRELDAVVQASRSEKHFLNGFEQFCFGPGSGIQSMHYAVPLDVFQDRILDARVVVAVVQRSCACEEI
jgi:hypothetical protein